MVLRATLRRLRSLKSFIFRVKKYLQHQPLEADTTNQQSQEKKNTATKMNKTSQAMIKGQQEKSGLSGVPLYSYNHTEDLLARIDKVFILYRSAINNDHGILFDYARCKQALALRSLVSLKMADILDTITTTKPVFEFHRLGLRLPAGPLTMNATYDCNVEICKVFVVEFGSDYKNTSMEMLGLITALHIISKALTWLKPLVPTSQLQQITTATGTSKEPLDMKSDASTNFRREIRRKSSKALLIDSMESLKKTTISNIRSGLGLTTIETSYDHKKELPENALDRWVLEERSYGKEPSLEHCQRILEGFKKVNEAYKDYKGQPPPPVSDTYGPITHALYLQRNGGRAPASGRPDVYVPRQSIQHLVAQRRYAEDAAKVAKTFADAKSAAKSEQASPYGNNLPSTSRPRLILNPGPIFSRSSTNLRDQVDKVTEPVPSAPHRFLGLGSSAPKVRNLPIKISGPMSVEHQASGASLTSYADIERAMRAAVNTSGSTTTSQAPRLPEQPVFQSLDMSDFKLPEQAIFPTPNLPPINASVVSSPALSSTVVTTPELVPTLRWDRLDESNKAAAKLTLSPEVVVKAKAKAKKLSPKELLKQSLLDQEAKAEDQIAQLLLMKSTLEAALDIVATQNHPQATIGEITDLAVAWGWFKDDPRGYRKQMGLE